MKERVARKIVKRLYPTTYHSWGAVFRGPHPFAPLPRQAARALRRVTAMGESQREHMRYVRAVQAFESGERDDYPQLRGRRGHRRLLKEFTCGSGLKPSAGAIAAAAVPGHQPEAAVSTSVRS